ncbi:MAG TPA: hypothetical protein VGE12_17640 [Noviherbaspirillum sp.]
MILLLKILLVPSLIGAITLAARRWGATVAGILAGFPVITGPILLLVALEQGPDFASDAAVGSIAAVMANVSFGIGYAWCAMRHPPWLSLIAGFLSFAVAGVVLNALALSLYPTFVLTLVWLWLAPKIFPKDVASQPLAKPFRGELVVRMAAGAVLALLVTVFADSLGPHLSGLFSVFPVLASIFAYFSHRFSGAGLAIDLLRAMATGFYGFAVFCLAVSVGLPQLGIAGSFILALACAVLVQTVLMWMRSPTVPSRQG